MSCCMTEWVLKNFVPLRYFGDNSMVLDLPDDLHVILNKLLPTLSSFQGIDTFP